MANLRQQVKGRVDYEQKAKQLAMKQTRQEQQTAVQAAAKLLQQRIAQVLTPTGGRIRWFQIKVDKTMSPLRACTLDDLSNMDFNTPWCTQKAQPFLDLLSCGDSQVRTAVEKFRRAMYRAPQFNAPGSSGVWAPLLGHQALPQMEDMAQAL